MEAERREDTADKPGYLTANRDREGNKKTKMEVLMSIPESKRAYSELLLFPSCHFLPLIFVSPHLHPYLHVWGAEWLFNSSRVRQCGLLGFMQAEQPILLATSRHLISFIAHLRFSTGGKGGLTSSRLLFSPSLPSSFWPQSLIHPPPPASPPPFNI